MTNLKKVFCKNCKKPIYRSAGRFNENLKFGWNFYCSKKCKYQYKTKKQKLICKNCSKVFKRTPSEISPHNYCSRSCAVIVNNKKSPKRKAQLKTCIKCGRHFKKGNGNLKYCSIKCRREARSYTSEQLIDIIKQFTQKFERVPARREMEGIVKSCIKIFGSWNNAIQAAGFIPNRSHDNRMYKRVSTKAIDGHLCDSVSELLIDNWLYKNNILHERDVYYPKTHHKADWAVSIKNKNKKIFVEYFGSANDSPRYDRAIKEKKKLCHKNKISLVPIYRQNLYPKEFLEDNLKEKFKNII